MTSEHPYARLVAPLRYASAHDFAKLGAVRGLRALLEAAVTEARARGGPAAPGVVALTRELTRIEAPSLAVRKDAIQNVLAALDRVRRKLPEPGVVAASTPPPVPPAVPIPAAPKAPPRKKASGRKEAQSEARLLSIAPREGPLATPLKEVGWKLNPRLISVLNRRGIHKVGDVLFLLPRVYEDRRKIETIARLRPGERGVTVGVIQSAGEVPFRAGKKIFRAVIGDASGTVSISFFQSGPWMKQRFPVGKRIVLSGELRASYSGREMVHPEVEPAEDLETSSVHFGRIVPVYPGFERNEQRAFRDLAFRIAAASAKYLEEPLPEAMRGRLKLLSLSEAITAIHFPAATEDLERLNRHTSPAHQRLAFDELFFLQLGMALKRQGIKVEPGIAFEVSPDRLQVARRLLPFELTQAQKRTVAEITRDMGRPEPMNRLLQGDVGSGKTAVAAVAAAVALQDGYQVALMAPTEILAAQHHRTFEKLLAPMHLSVGLVRGGGTAKEKRLTREQVASGALRVAVGTHALIEGGTQFERLGLVIIDEQHRFGVLQRHRLMNKGVRPDVLVMTATPIPRTLAMTLYGDLDLSVIDELPPGRTPIATRVFYDKQRARVYEAVAQELAKKHQAYIVYPLVEESEKVDLADATRGAQTIAAAFPEARVGLLHGRMKPEEKDAVMSAFRAGELQILVATTVIEVGVDVPNASVMVIEHAERFGLSQLHQLRGRVGRGAAQSYCFLVSGGGMSSEASERLSVMVESTDGFVIAEKDLELRGPGEFLGTRQSGIPELAVANLARDQALLATASAEARAIVEGDPTLGHPEHARLVRALEERWEGRLALARVG